MTVTVNGQTLTATPSGGAWSVTSAILANATYPVVASVTDGAGNPGSATQQLTVDTVPPVVTLAGGPSVATNDPTPTIAGTSDVAPGTVVHVVVGSLTLTALVQPGGTWNVTPAALTDDTYSVTASVTDPAGNPGTDSQTLIVDTTAPAATIAGGASALTNDATPDISGTAAVAPGTIVTVTLADETLTGIVQANGTWTVAASFLSDGPHRVVMGVFDAAGNQAISTQWLTVDTVAPAVSISGGPTASTSDSDPTISGTSSAAPGTIVTVSIAGQTMTTVIQADGSWNATPTPPGAGTWAVTASAPDPAGNVGSAGQTLTIGPGATGSIGSTELPVLPVTPVAPVAPVAPVTPLAPVTPVTPISHLTPAPDRRRSVDAVAKTKVAAGGSLPLTGAVLSIGTKVTAPVGGRVVVKASGTVKIAGVTRAIMLTSKIATLPAGRNTTLRLVAAGSKTVARAAFARLKAAVRSGKTVTATIAIRIVGAAGNTRVVQRTVTLT